MKTLSIRVPYTPGRPGFDGPGRQRVGLVILRLHDGADVERFEDAAGAAEGDLAAALLLERQAELAAATGRPWVAATKAMRARAILDADGLQLSARTKRQAGKNSGEVRAGKGEDNLAQVAPLFAAAREKLLAEGYKRPGAESILLHARRDAAPDYPQRKLLTRHYVDRWLDSLKPAKPSKKRGSN